MACTVSYNIFDSKHLVPVSVIVTFNIKGEMRPDYVQIINKDKSQDTFKIYNATLQKQVYAYMQYSCKIAINDLLKEINLTFFISEHTWCIGK